MKTVLLVLLMGTAVSARPVTPPQKHRQVTVSILPTPRPAFTAETPEAAH